MIWQIILVFILVLAVFMLFISFVEYKALKYAKKKGGFPAVIRMIIAVSVYTIAGIFVD